MRISRLRNAAITLASAVGFIVTGDTAARAQDVQKRGAIVGRIVDAQTGQGLPSASIQDLRTRTTVVSGVDGRFRLANLPAGNATLRVALLGYGQKSIAGIVVPANGTVEENVSLSVQALQIAAVEVNATAERGSVNRALDQQRSAVGVSNAVTVQQIARSPDGDAAAAVQRVSGVSVLDGKYVLVRGLGERYTTTALNGARIPSPEPDRKVVPLDMFPASLIQSVTTLKTFTPDMPGDFSGAQVDIQTREFPARRQLSFNSTLGYNAAATGVALSLAPTASMDWLAFGSGDREVPIAIQRATFEPRPTQQQTDQMVRSFRNQWSPRQRNGSPNASFGLSLGGNEDILGRRFGYVASGTYSATSEIRADEVRAQALAGDAGSTREVDRFTGSTGRRSVLLGGLLNASTLFGNHTRLALNNTYNRTADNDARREVGNSENLGALLQIDRLKYVERAVRSSQLLGEHQLGDRNRLDWRVTASGVTRAEPDRSEFVSVIEEDANGNLQAPAWLSVSDEGAVRTFANLQENALEGSFTYKLTLGRADRQHVLKLGGLARSVDRDEENTAYSLSARGLTLQERQLPPEEIFSRTLGTGAQFIVSPMTQGGGYTAEDKVAAGFAMAEMSITPRVRLIGGARVERSHVVVDASSTLAERFLSDRTYTDVLPSAALTVDVGDDHKLRFSASQTLSRPEYRELAGIQFRSVVGGDIVVGNADLRRSLVRSFDARWEWYPTEGEVLSVGVFAKRFLDPIERVYLGTSGTRFVTFANASGAENLGVELEIRKHLGFIAEPLSALTVFSNATFMRSEIRLGGGEGLASKLNDERPMVGQSPYLINAGITYASAEQDRSATVLYNVVGKRITSASEAPLPDVYELPRHAIDLSLRFPLKYGVSAKLDARNLLDAPYEQRQGVAVREYYRSGRILSFGLSVRR